MQRIDDILYFVRTIYRYLRLVIFLFNKSSTYQPCSYFDFISVSQNVMSFIRTISGKSRFIEGKKGAKYLIEETRSVFIARQ
mgnify:CR=1 FL=1